MIKWIVALALLTSKASAQEFYVVDEAPIERIRTYSEGLIVARAERRPMLILFTQKVCPPCKVAKSMLLKMIQARELSNMVIVEMDSTEAGAGAFMIGPTTPQFVVVDVPTLGVTNAVTKWHHKRQDRDAVLTLIGAWKRR